jgi:hypothetical protein
LATASLFRALTLFVAVSEQVLLEIERGGAVEHRDFASSIQSAHDAAIRTLGSSEFTDRPGTSGGQLLNGQ